MFAFFFMDSMVLSQETVWIFNNATLSAVKNINNVLNRPEEILFL